MNDPASARFEADLSSEDPLLSYVPRLVVDWLRERPEERHRAIDGTCMFADISGFTSLTERLAKRGKVGAEEMGEVLNAAFEQLLGVAYDFGAGLVKWGGDAVLLLFDGEGHVDRAARAAIEMQQVMGRIGRLGTSVGSVQLKMSVGLHRAAYDFYLVGDRFRELIVTGPEATTLAQMEKVAEAGEVVVSGETARALDPTHVGEARGAGYLLAGAPLAPRNPNRERPRERIDLSGAMAPTIAEHLRGGAVEGEHRNVTVCFLQVTAVAELLAASGVNAVTQAVERFVETCQAAAEEHSVTFLSSDICEDGAKVILIAGAPTSYGDDETRVLSAARNVMDADNLLPVKAGINSGRVFAGNYGPAYRRVYSVTGDAVNLAARLMGHAEPGQVIVNSGVIERSRTRFETTALVPFAVKGKAEPVEAQLLGPMVANVAPIDEPTGPLMGRASELDVLLAGAEAAQHGVGRVVEIVGPAGIGKSRLLQELVARAEVRPLWADGDIYARSTPYAPLQRLFREELGLTVDASGEEAGRSLGALMESLDPGLLPWLPLLAIVAGADVASTPEVDALDREFGQARLDEVTSQALGAIFDAPIVLVFNDVHFMDEASLSLLRKLCSDCADRPWLLVITRRPDSESPLRSDTDVNRIVLEPIDAAAASAFVESCTEESPLPAHTVAEIVRRAGGNPLYLRELVQTLVERGSESELPDSVEGMLAARIDSLLPRQRALLRAASVLGMRVDVKLLGEVLSIDGSGSRPVDSDWSGLEEFIVVEGSRHRRFTHHLVREAAYEGLAFRRRAVLHARAADVLERDPRNVSVRTDVLSMHCFFGERYQAAWEYARQAAREASKRYATADAAALLRRALQASDRVSGLAETDVLDVCEGLAQAYDDLGEFTNAESVLQRARALPGNDPVRRARWCLKISTIRERGDQFPAALRWLTKGLSALEGNHSKDAGEARAALMTRYARVRTLQCRFTEAIRWAEQGIAEAETVGDRSTMAHCLEYVDFAEMGIGRASPEAPALRALAIYEELGDLSGQASSQNMLGARCYYLGQWPEALAYYRAAEEAFERSGSLWGTAMPKASRGEILSDQGNLAEARVLIEEALRVSRRARKEDYIAFCRYLLGRLDARSGEFQRAHQSYEEARRHFQDAGVVSLEVFVDALEAESYLLEGDAPSALALARVATERAQRMGGMATTLPLLLRVRGLALSATGDAELGRRDLLESLDLARAQDARHEVAFTLRGLFDAGVVIEGRTAFEAEFAELSSILGLVADSSFVSAER